MAAATCSPATEVPAPNHRKHRKDFDPRRSNRAASNDLRYGHDRLPRPCGLVGAVSPYGPSTALAMDVSFGIRQWAAGPRFLAHMDIVQFREPTLSDLEDQFTDQNLADSPTSRPAVRR
jgi:hypothetical protein